MSNQLLIYGATGYTGKLIARQASNWDLQPVLAGRTPEKVNALATELGLPGRVFSLDDQSALDAALKDITVVLHCAGPFSATAIPMFEACLRTGTHYLDITGEIDVFEALAARNREAEEKNMMAMPGVGFDVVPTDCLAAHLAARLPEANKLVLAIAGVDSPSRGTAKTALENIHSGSRIRKNGKIITLPGGSLTRQFDFGKGPRPCLAIGWGDVSTAYHSTGIGNIEVYFKATKMLNSMTTAGKYLGWLLKTGPLQSILKNLVDKQPEGPDETELHSRQAVILGFAEDGQGNQAAAKLTTPAGYKLTYLTGLEIAKRVLQGQFKSGFQTPSKVFGADFITGIEGVNREDS